MNTAIKLASGATVTSTSNTASAKLSLDGGATTVSLDSGGSWDANGVPMTVVVPVSTLNVDNAQTYSFTVQDSVDGATWTNRSPTRLASDDSGPNTTGASGTIIIAAEIKYPAHVRLAIVVAGTSPTITFGDITISPRFAFWMACTVVNCGGGWLSFQPITGGTEYSEPIFAAIGLAANDSRSIDVTNLNAAANALFAQGATALIAFAANN